MEDLSLCFDKKRPNFSDSEGKKKESMKTRGVDGRSRWMIQIHMNDNAEKLPNIVPVLSFFILHLWKLCVIVGKLMAFG